jgi:adenylate cyclase
MEIERKWLVPAIPSWIMEYQPTHIDQGYVLSNKNVSIRVRAEKNCIKTVYTMTVKSGQGMSRQEYEVEIDKDTFNELWIQTEGNRIEKARFKIPMHNGLKIEFDFFGGNNIGLLLAEVEFKDQDEAVNYIAPDWFGEDVTFDGRYTNAELSKNKVKTK